MNAQKFDTIKIPEIFYHPTKIGIPLLDAIFSINGGLIPSMSYMFTGVSGAGKTTICNYIMSGISSQEHPAVFISLEMSKEQSKYQFEGKVDFSNTYILDKLENNTIEDFQKILDDIAKLNPAVVVLDSLQMAVAQIYGSPTSTKGQSQIANMMLKFSKKTLCPTIIIGQCAKDGGYLGPSSVKHVLDGHLHATYDPKTALRTVSFEKNRFGQVGKLVAYKFSPNGSLEFMEVNEFMPHYIDAEFSWLDAEAITEDIYKSVLMSELNTILKNEIPIPNLKFKGSKKEPYHSVNYHTNVNSWMHFPEEPYFIYNTVYIDLEYSKKRYTEENLDNLKSKFSMYLDRYPQFKKPTDFYILQLLILLCFGLLLSQEQNDKFWKTLDRLVANHS